MNDVVDILKRAISELRDEGLEPDLLLVGPGFIQHAADALREYRFHMKIYQIDELGFDAVVADSSYLGQIKRASRRISIEPLFQEKEMWEELESLDV